MYSSMSDPESSGLALTPSRFLREDLTSSLCLAGQVTKPWAVLGPLSHTIRILGSLGSSLIIFIIFRNT